MIPTVKIFDRVVIRGIVFVLLAVLALFLLLRCGRAYREPRYHGRRLSEWAENLNPSAFSQEEDHEAAAEAIRQIGTNALPMALAFCRDTKSSEDPGRNLGGNIFKALGPVGQPAIPELVRLLDGADSVAADRATGNLHFIGPAAVPQVLVVLTNGTKEGRRLACCVLGGFGPQSKAAVAPLLQCLQDEDRELRDWAAWALAKIGGDPAILVPAFVTYLGNKTNRPPFELFDTLGGFGTNARPAVQVLTNLIDSPHMTLRSSPALVCLYRIDPQLGRSYAQKRAEPQPGFDAPGFIAKMEFLATNASGYLNPGERRNGSPQRNPNAGTNAPRMRRKD